ncbi:UPF0052-domain-containing protein [Irpex rosettiformis]|uniref:UPF0052-domain-containing protein n=1 Tax=Irpex rosettiformis TaxID=378272 RepID=A0ACB8U6F4_9APHY|nr:UPF0052-domain-containing protein [Irpex rosettiformis]
MAFLDPNPKENILDSPGSSVFDLPTQSTQATEKNKLNDAQFRTSGSNSHTSLAGIDASTLYQDAGPSFLVISGGTGCNSICSAFGNATYVLPVSDDGGSSSEIIRVIGGPSVGDIRSRLIRLIPSSPPYSPLDRIRNLLAYRLPAHASEREARDEWRDIVEGRSILWSGIPNDRKETIRGFLVYFENEVLRRAHKNFSFLNGSIGNYFISAAQEFFRSLPSAIFLFSSITNSQASILPVIVTNHTVTIAAELEDGSRLVGQCEISHPILQPSGPSITFDNEEENDGIEASNSEDDDDLDGTINKPQNVLFEATKKDEYHPLDSKIARLYYINAYGSEIHPSPNPDYITHLGLKDVLVYSCGSLWTSIVPCLALRGVANAIARSKSLRAKILLLNSQNDRETDGYSAADYIMTVVRTLNTSYQRHYVGLGDVSTLYPTSAFVTHLLYLKGTIVPVDVEQLTILGVKCVQVEATPPDDGKPPKFDAQNVREAILEVLRQGDAD